MAAANLAGTPAAATDSIASEGRVWLVVSHAEDAEIAELDRTLGSRARLVSDQAFTGIDVRLYELARP